ncbi:MAG TPA: MmpS family transport accessory protein [Aldersonia sp.]
MLDQVSAHLRSDGRDLNCSYLLGLDGFTMNLQPTAEAGKLRFAQFLGWHKGALESMGETQDRRWPSQAGQFLADVVPGADESWFDLSAMSTDQYPRYELVARQGGLLIGLELSTLTDAETDQPTLAVQRMADLAGLLLQRVPSLGKTDTGTTLVGQYEVYGQGSVNISYADPTTAPDFIELAAVPLPWFVNIPMATPSEGEIPFLGISAWRSQPFTQVGCRILLNGTVVDEQQQSSAVFCDAAGLDFSR